MNSGGAGDQQGWRGDQARPYHSPRRQLQAEQTRAEILAAARRLFSERGYAATPIQRQSRRRGRVGADALHERRVKGPDRAVAGRASSMTRSTWTPSLRLSTPPTTAQELLWANARLTRVLHERCGDIIRALLSAAAADADVAPAEAEGRRVHREGCLGVVEQLHAMQALAKHVTVDRASAILTTLTAPESVDRLTREHGWTYEELEEWLAGQRDPTRPIPHGWPPGRGGEFSPARAKTGQAGGFLWCRRRRAV